MDVRVAATVHVAGREHDVSARTSDARDEVIGAALRLVATEWNNGRQTAAHSMDLDWAQDTLDDALQAYSDAVIDELVEQGRLLRP